MLQFDQVVKVVDEIDFGYKIRKLLAASWKWVFEIKKYMEINGSSPTLTVDP